MQTGGQASSSVMERRRRRSSAAEPWDTGQSTFRPILAPRTAGVDVNRSFEFATADVGVGEE
jgi:hypothetical protein